MQKKFYLTEQLPPYIFASMYELKQQAIEDGKAHTLILEWAIPILLLLKML